MPDRRIKGLCLDLYRRLKEGSRAHHCSVDQEIREILELYLGRRGVADIKPFVFGEPLTDSFIKKARRESRA
jgi:hypothetical protein